MYNALCALVETVYIVLVVPFYVYLQYVCALLCIVLHNTVKSKGGYEKLPAHARRM